MIKMVALILGGGAGSRLYPLTSKRSKPAVPIGGKYRLIDIPISNCLNSGLKRMFVVTQYNSASLNQHIKNSFHFDHFSHGFVDILAAEQTPGNDLWFQGTADAVRQTMHHFDKHDCDYILILSGDQIYQMDLEKMAEHHIKKKAELTIATIPVNAKDATGFGIMKVNEKGMIDKFIEKPDIKVLEEWKSPVSPENEAAGKPYLASMGIYIFNKKSLKKFFDKDPTAMDFGKNIIPAAIENGHKVASYAYDGYWADIGTIGSFYEANIALTDDIPKFNLFDSNKPVYTRPRLLAPSKVYGTWFNQAIMAEGSFIHAKKIERSVIGIRARIGENTEISNSIIMGNDYYESMEQIMDESTISLGVGKNCYVRNAILDKNCRIGDNVHIHGSVSLEDAETDSYCIRDGVIVVKKSAVIRSGTHIGLDWAGDKMK
jgi:glucose-1-phosphate adenylyltransferase